MKRWIPYLASIALSLSATALWLQSQTLRRERATAAEKIDRWIAAYDSLLADHRLLQSDHDKLTIEQREMHKWIGPPAADTPGDYWFRELMKERTERATLLSKQEVAELEEMGLEDPAAHIRSDLMAHPELIPFPGVLGGRMGFYHGDEIAILTSEWAFARFGDGHVGGSCLLEYSIQADTTIRWEVLCAGLDR